MGYEVSHRGGKKLTQITITSVRYGIIALESPAQTTYAYWRSEHAGPCRIVVTYLVLSSSASSPLSVPTSSAIFSTMSSMDSSAVLNPPRDASVGLT
jgi:hypothetical protein